MGSGRSDGGTFENSLAAPCGMYCGSCRHYLAREMGLLKEKGLKTGSIGCRARNKKCAFIKKSCNRIGTDLNFCFECNDFPCENLSKLNRRYVDKYGVSLTGNLLRVKEIGEANWLIEQQDKWKCPHCGGCVSIHDGECYSCRRRINKK